MKAKVQIIPVSTSFRPRIDLEDENWGLVCFQLFNNEKKAIDIMEKTAKKLHLDLEWIK